MFYFIRYTFLYLVVSAVCLGSSQQQSEHQFIEYGRFLVTMTTNFSILSKTSARFLSNIRVYSKYSAVWLLSSAKCDSSAE